MSTVLERSVERILVDGVKARGGLCLKLNSSSHVGVPDRVVLWGSGKATLVEVKQTKGKRSPAQVVWHRKALALGIDVVVLHGADEVREWLDAQK